MVILEVMISGFLSGIRECIWGRSLKVDPLHVTAHAVPSVAVQVLDLGRANLTLLDENTFLGLESLRLLSLSQNDLTQLPEELLKPLPKVEKLFFGGKADETGRIIVQGNLLRFLPKDFFFYTKHLKIVDLSENKLEHLPAHSFQGLNFLQTLDLQTNHISQISRKPFAGLTSLQTLNLGGNQISEISRQPFAGLRPCRPCSWRATKFHRFQANHLQD